MGKHVAYGDDGSDKKRVNDSVTFILTIHASEAGNSCEHSTEYRALHHQISVN